MLNQIQLFEGNALALELTGTFTLADEKRCEQLFTEKLREGHEQVNLLIKVKDLAQFKDMDLKAFFEGEFWGIRNFRKLGRCAVVAHSDFIKAAVNVESRILPLFNEALEEKYFEEAQLEEALAFISPVG
jgi:hypothetical protein